MTKSVKHKRQRKEDFKKLKLKIGKRLKKAQNETKTDFKTRKIILKEQLPVKVQSSLITKKQLNIKELLSRLSHNSIYVRQDGINGLIEIASENTKNELTSFLSNILYGIVPCILDPDHLIRSSILKLLEILFAKMGNLMDSYFELLATHLSCAMVNLNIGIQTDSLKLMGVFLSYKPSLIAQKSNTLLNNYLSLISRKMDKGKSHTLLSNPNSKLVTHNWRIKMLTNFSSYLMAILDERKKLEKSIPLTSWEVIEIGCFPPLMKEGGSRSLIQKIKILTDEAESKNFITTLVPLLFQIWSEVSSSQTNSEEANLLDLSAILMLKSISQILIHLWNINEIVTRENPNQCTWFMKLLKSDVETMILNGFPYCSLEIPTKKKQKETLNSEIECESLNVVLANLSFLFMEKNHKQNIKIVTFYSELLSTNFNMKNIHLEDIVPTASSLLKDKRGLPIKLRENLLLSSYTSYQNLSNKSKYCLLKMPLTASSQECEKIWKSNNSNALKSWMMCLINEALTSSDPEPIFDVLIQFRLRNTPGFAQIMKNNKQRFKDKMYHVQNGEDDKLGFEIVI